MRTTTKDLAKAAGVSLATVDRVLNDRSSVSAKSRAKVLEAIEQTGFVRNSAAGNLARGRDFQFRFVLPKEGDQYLRALLAQIQELNDSLAPEMIAVDSHQVSIRDPHAFAQYLSDLTPGEVDGVAVMAPESPPVRDALTRLTERGIQVVQFLSGQENIDQFDFVGVDNFAAGSTAGRLMGRFLPNSAGKVMVISETMQALDSIQRRLGFDQIIGQHFLNLTVLPSLETYANELRAERIIERQFEQNSDIVGVYVLSPEARIPLESVSRFRELNKLNIIVHERTEFSEHYLSNSKIDAIIAQNPGHAVTSALHLMRSRIEKRAPFSKQVDMRIEILLQDNL